MIPTNSAFMLYVNCPCEKHAQYWLNLRYRAIKLKQDSLLVGDCQDIDIKKCPKCELRFGDHDDWLAHCIDDHDYWP